MLKLKLQYFGHLIQRTDSFEKTLMLGKIEQREEKMTEDEMVIYYCGQESLRRNGVAITVNKRVQDAVLGCSLKNKSDL